MSAVDFEIIRYRKCSSIAEIAATYAFAGNARSYNQPTVDRDIFTIAVVSAADTCTTIARSRYRSAVIGDIKTFIA